MTITVRKDVRRFKAISENEIIAVPAPEYPNGTHPRRFDRDKDRKIIAVPAPELPPLQEELAAAQERRNSTPSYDLFLTPFDLLQTTDPDPVYLIGGELLTLEKGDLVLMDAPPGGKKSLLAMDIAVCVASGHSWLGQPTTKSKVLYIDFENGRRRGKNRLLSAMNGYGVDPHISLATIFNMKIDLMQDGNIGDVMWAIEKSGAELVVIDTLTRTHRGRENESGDMKIVMEQWAGLTRQFGCCILIIHHAGKGGEYRGSTEIQGTPDVHYQIASTHGQNAVTVKSKKLRDGGLIDFDFEFVFSEGRTYTVPKEKMGAENGDAPKEEGKRKQCADLIMSQVAKSEELVKWGDLRDYALNKGYTQSTFNNALNDLKSEGLIALERIQNVNYYKLPK